YRFDPRADRLLALLFPTTIPYSGVTNAYAERNRELAFTQLSEVCRHHSRGISLSSEVPATIDITDDNLESYWLSQSAANHRAEAVLQRAAQVEALARGLSASPLRFASPLEKALFQRDVFQICAVFRKAVEAISDSTARGPALAALRALGALWRAL